MNKKAGLFLGFLLLLAPAVDARRKGSPWTSSYSKSLERAKRADKLLFIFFTDRKKPSRRLWNGPLKARAVGSRLRKSFIPVRIRSDRDYAMVKAFQVHDFPAVKILNTDQVILLQKSGGIITSETILGWMSEGEAIAARLKKLEGKVARNPKDYPTALALFKDLYRFGERHGSIAAFEKIIELRGKLKKDPGNNFKRYAGWAHAKLARRYMDSKLPKLAMPHIASYRELDPKNKFKRLPEILVAEAEVLRKLKEFKRAVELLERPAKKFKKDPGADLLWFHLGVNRYLLGQRKPAVEALSEILERYPDSAKISAARKLIATIESESKSEQEEGEEAEER